MQRLWNDRHRGALLRELSRSQQWRRCITGIYRGGFEVSRCAAPRAARTTVNRSGRSFTCRFNHFLMGIGLLSLLGFSYPSLAGMTWSARAIDPSLIGAIKSDSKLLDQTLFGDQPEVFTEKLKKEGRVDLSDKQIRDELTAWAAKRKAEVGAPAATSTSPTRGRGKLLHLAMAGRAMITRFDAPWQDVQRIP